MNTMMGVIRVENTPNSSQFQYKILQRGGFDCRPFYLCTAVYNENTCYGIGSSYTEAKKNAFDNILSYLDTKCEVNIPSEFDFYFPNQDVPQKPRNILISDAVQQPVKRQKTEIAANSSSQKNPISLLNELKPSAIFTTLEQLGPSHAPTFKVAVKVDGQTFIGCGKTKKIAKAKAAELALQSFIQLPTNGQTFFPQSSSTSDFTNDNLNNSTNSKASSTNSSTSKGALMLLNELYPGAKFEFIEHENESYGRFKAIVTIGKETFEGSGSRKQLAKHAAAAAALAKLAPEYAEKSASTTYKKQIVPVEQQNLADHIGRMVLEKFIDLMKNDSVHAKRKVLAGIVMTRGNDLDSAKLITVTTGTKCISGEYISLNGGALNDLHAEIVARRCLRLYFYDQLELALSAENQDFSIFEPRQDGNGFKLKDGIDFHLYINTAPCGDARIFSPKEETVEEIDRHPQRISRGQLRTKIESGEGTIPVMKQNTIQTWDGVLQGERLLTMSCSDKIARWNVLGLQGSLLSNFVDPIYLKSIILGSLLNETHLYRAICGRIENTLSGLPPPYSLNRPFMLLTTSSETRLAVKAPSFSVNWIVGYGGPEVINTNTGKPEHGLSKVCKRNLMKRFLELRKMCNAQNDAISYSDAKATASDYNIAKQQMFKAFSSAGLGLWIKKPIEQDEFEVQD